MYLYILISYSLIQILGFTHIYIYKYITFYIYNYIYTRHLHIPPIIPIKAVMSYAFVMIYATLHTRSPFLALVGLFLVMLSIPATLAVFVLVSGSGEFSLMMPGWLGKKRLGLGFLDGILIYILTLYVHILLYNLYIITCGIIMKVYESWSLMLLKMGFNSMMGLLCDYYRI